MTTPHYLGYPNSDYDAEWEITGECPKCKQSMIIDGDVKEFLMLGGTKLTPPYVVEVCPHCGWPYNFVERVLFTNEDIKKWRDGAAE